MSCRYAAQRCAHQVRAASRLRPASASVAALSAVTPSRIARRHNSTEAAVDPKISGIVDQISQLTLLETASLVSSLKTRLNIPDLPVGGFAAAPAAPGGAAAAAAAEEEEAPAAAAEKSLFTVKLVSIEAGSKPKIIKEVKSLLGLSLVDSKKFVESAPKVMKESVPKEDAEKMMATLKELGATVTIE
ncbi:50S ribosomal protein l12 [Niveomyces insectorum RCEF 264]|uniref:50S ribosomal protein l12 n=1 Tax=Niveomyces insectorum RCEF 264 TaxID=1081102 RepID=A0A167N2U2_9HYPO|nr:50S ribosomal protein l12 [Niveomyces insectorum RCEF 264]